MSEGAAGFLGSWPSLIMIESKPMTTYEAACLVIYILTLIATCFGVYFTFRVFQGAQALEAYVYKLRFGVIPTFATTRNQDKIKITGKLEVSNLNTITAEITDSKIQVISQNVVGEIVEENIRSENTLIRFVGPSGSFIIPFEYKNEFDEKCESIKIYLSLTCPNPRDSDKHVTGTWLVFERVGAYARNIPCSISLH